MYNYWKAINLEFDYLSFIKFSLLSQIKIEQTKKYHLIHLNIFP